MDAADAAATFLAAQNVEQSRIDRVWDAIAPHTTFSIPQKKSPEAALVQIGAGWTWALSHMTHHAGGDGTGA